MPDGPTQPICITSDVRQVRLTVLKLAWPVIAQNCLHTCMFVADTLLVGWYNIDSLAALGITLPIFFSITSLLMAVSIGTMATVARSTGERDEGKTIDNAAASLWFSIVVGVAVSVVGFIFAHPIVEIFTRSGEQALGPSVAWEAFGYFRIVFATFWCAVITLSITAIFRGAGDTKTPMLVGLIANVLNVFGNYVLIFGKFGMPEMGLWGAALSTSLSRILEVVLLVLVLLSRRSRVVFRMTDLRRVSCDALKRLLRVATPAAVEPLVMHSGFLVYTWIVAGLGTAALAGHRIAITIESVSFMPGMGVAIACSAIVGQCLGAGAPESADIGRCEAARLTMWGMSILGFCLVLFPRQLAGLFLPPDMNSAGVNKDAVISLATGAIAFGAIQQPFLALAMVYVGALRGAGDTRSPVLIAAIGVWLVRVPLSLLLAPACGLMGIWFTTGIDWAVRALASWLMLRRGVWRRIKL